MIVPTVIAVRFLAVAHPSIQCMLMAAMPILRHPNNRCGSAALGGYIADKHSYDYTFLITAALQFTACMMLLPLLALVPSEVKKPKSQELKPVYDDDENAEDEPLLSVNGNSDNVYE